MKRGTAVAATFVALAGLGVLLPLRSDAFAPDAELKSDKTCDSGPLSSPRANCAPPPLASTGNLNDDCVARINQLRWACQCLPPLTRWKGGEPCAGKHGHYVNMSNPSYERVACGFAKSADGDIWSVQNFR